MTYEVLYQNPGEKHWHLCFTTRNLDAAKDRRRKLWGPLAAAVNYTLMDEEGTIIHDTRAHGLLA